VSNAISVFSYTRTRLTRYNIIRGFLHHNENVVVGLECFISNRRYGIPMPCKKRYRNNAQLNEGEKRIQSSSGNWLGPSDGSRSLWSIHIDLCTYIQHAENRKHNIHAHTTALFRYVVIFILEICFHQQYDATR